MKNETQTKVAARPAGKGKTSRDGKNDAGAVLAEVAPAAEEVVVREPTNEKGETVCTSDTTLTAEQLLELYRHLLLTRLVRRSWLTSTGRRRSSAASSALWVRRRRPWAAPTR